MDIDRYVAEHQATWARLDELNRKGRSVRRLSAAELDEIVSLYQRVSTHLSYVRTYLPDPALVTRLTALVATANGIVYGRRSGAWSSFSRFFSRSFPAAVWINRWFVLAAALLLLVPALVLGVWIASSPAAFEATAPAAVREAYINDDFESYYSSEPAAQFASEVFTNNVRVAILAFAAGVLFCVVTAYILVYNGASLGVVAGLFAAMGEQPKFWGLILPHGLLELSAVAVAGAAGLRLGWTVIDPGDRPRLPALAEEGRRAAVIVLGLVAAFLVAGLIEGFVTGRVANTALRVAIGVTAFAAFWTYVVAFGRIALAEGYTGLLSDERRAAEHRAAALADRAATAPTAA
jgi:uncharacterized membrane protein SpoIIM required for sporulation